VPGATWDAQILAARLEQAVETARETQQRANDAIAAARSLCDLRSHQGSAEGVTVAGG
jgi:hypothetical protein